MFAGERLWRLWDEYVLLHQKRGLTEMPWEELTRLSRLERFFYAKMANMWTLRYAPVLAHDSDLQRGFVSFVGYIQRRHSVPSGPNRAMLKFKVLWCLNKVAKEQGRTIQDVIRNRVKNLGKKIQWVD